MIIYLAVNRVNQKAYVGQTRYPLTTRVSTHLWRGKYIAKASYFQRAMAKYGLESFDFAVLQECDNREDLCLAERYWIQRLSSLAPIGYNIGSGGEGSGGVHQKSEKWRAAVTSPEYRKKHSDRVKMLRGTPEYIEQANKQGEHVRQLRASLTPEKREEWRVNAANARRGISSGMFGDKNVSKRPEVREKIRLSKLGIPRSEECKRKISETKLVKRNAKL